MEEMATTAAVSYHPNVVRILGLCEDSGEVHIVLERADGRCGPRVGRHR